MPRINGGVWIFGGRHEDPMRRGKRRRWLVYKDCDQEYAQVFRMLEDGRSCEAFCMDGIHRVCDIGWRTHGSGWLAAGDIVLVGLRVIQDHKPTVIHKYWPNEVRRLQLRRRLPDNLRLNEDFPGGDDDVEFQEEDLDWMYFIVDTGASTLIIAPQKARELGLSTFGEVHITAVNGLIRSQYCRANTFQLGQLRISNPVFMEIPVSELVGDPFVIGMCGFDIFSHCIVEMAYDGGRLSLFDPAIYRLLHSESLEWHTLRLLESVTLEPGGVDVIFHGRAVKKFDVLSCVQTDTYAQLMGINPSGKGLEVKAMLATENAGTSEYVAGLLCGDLLSQCRVVFDYGQRRFAITYVAQTGMMPTIFQVTEVLTLIELIGLLFDLNK